MDLKRSIRARDSVVCREMDDEVILLERNSGRIAQLNYTAGIIWYSIDGKATVEDIYRELLDLFKDVHQERIRGDLFATLRHLEESGMIDMNGDDDAGNSVPGG